MWRPSARLGCVGRGVSAGANSDAPAGATGSLAEHVSPHRVAADGRRPATFGRGLVPSCSGCAKGGVAFPRTPPAGAAKIERHPLVETPT